ncbi:MFS transporter [Nocardia sp. CDC160]|uniref:MFS transporter n=1 Tax=Nocardia sp. CDC160 TaxID=3112166 RepID=UPI002DB5AF7B|nr:MFS transporter [Nocardia sp. CDC160]MEC3918914.1 MFS transporter [Nocardia sp. CDC160]
MAVIGGAALAGGAGGKGTARPGIALATVTAVLFVTFLDTTVVSVALADIRSELSTDVVLLQWVVNAYTLVFASLMLAAGSLGDRWGRKRVMVAGLAIFCVGSVLSALATSVPLLIAGRAVMGLGAAASEPGTLSILRQVFPDARRRAKALGVWSAVSGLALAAGPVLGGVLVDAYGWRSIFWFNLIIGVVVGAAALWFVPESSDPQPGPMDWAGSLLGAVSLAAIIYAAISGEHRGYGAASVVALFVVGGLAFLGFVAVETRVRNPVFDFRYLRLPPVRSALGVAFAVYFGVFSIFFFTALYLQVMIHYSAARTAGVFAPMAVAIMLGSLAAGFWVARTDARTPMIIGCVLSAAGILLTRHALTGSIGFAELSATLALAGLGFGIAVVPLTSAVLTGVPAEHSGMAAAATNTMRQVGAAVGVAVLGSLVNGFLTADLDQKLTELGLPKELQPIAVDAVERGRIPSGVDLGTMLKYASKVPEVLATGTVAFHHGLDVALVVSALMILAAAVLSVLTLSDSGDSGRWWRELPPAMGAFVMATGIISVGLHLTGFELLSRAGLALAAMVWLALATDFVSRLLWTHTRWETEADTPPALMAVSATCVLGARIALLGWDFVATALLVIAVILWPVLLTLVIAHWNRRMPGAVFLVCVATEGLAVLGVTLAQAGVGDWLATAALVCFVLGLLLYLAAFAHFDLTQIWRGAGDQWVMTGSIAISALAASKLVGWHGWTGTAHSTLRVLTVVLVGINLTFYVILLIAEVVRFRPGYNVRRWATVFPLGMTAVAALSTGAALDLGGIATLGKALLVVAAVVWLLFAAELIHTWATGGRRDTEAVPAEK